MKKLVILAFFCAFVSCSGNKQEGATDPKKEQSINPKKDQSVKIPETGKIVEVDGDLLTNVKIPTTLVESLVDEKDQAHVDVSDLVSKIKKNEPLSFKQITRLFISKHLRLYDQARDQLKIADAAPSIQDFTKTLGEIESKIKEKTDLHVLKTQVDEALGIKTYNRDYATVPNVVLQKKTAMLFRHLNL